MRGAPLLVHSSGQRSTECPRSSGRQGGMRCLRAVCAAAALMVVFPGEAAPALADCIGQCADQASLLAPFNALLDTPAGTAVLDANLQTQTNIYLNATQAQKIAAGPILILPALAANVLLRAFP